MPNVFDVARYLLEKGGPMSTLRLHKLCFYAQAWSLVWDKAPLFDEEFEAWGGGPVCRPLYERFKDQFRISASDLPGHADFTTGQIETMDAVLRDYAQFKGIALAELVRMEEPWRNARLKNSFAFQRGEIISREDMASYYDAIP